MHFIMHVSVVVATFPGLNSGRGFGQRSLEGKKYYDMQKIYPSGYGNKLRGLFSPKNNDFYFSEDINFFKDN